MRDETERAALILLLRDGARPWQQYVELVEQAGSALAVLDQELGMLAHMELDTVIAELRSWQASGIAIATVLDSTYPENLRSVHDRPPLLFVAGALQQRDSRAVAVIGSRAAGEHGLSVARATACELVRHDYTVVSGLAAGIDTAAHRAAIAAGGRTIAVIGTGLDRAYPEQNAGLQSLISRECAVLSQFWPNTPPTRRTFPMRNAVMSGISLATVIVEATHTSGARTQARLALAHGRRVFLLSSLLEQSWARELARRPGTCVLRSPSELPAAVEPLTETAGLTF